MSIQYRMEGQTDNLNPEGSKKQGLYPRVVSRDTLTLKQLAERAADGTTFNSFEVEMSARLLIAQIVKELKAGNNACLDEFGTFSFSAESTRKVQDEHEIRAESIRVKRVVFKTSSYLMKSLQYSKFERIPKK